MGFLNQDEINLLRSNANIVDIIGGYIPLTKKGKNYFGVCPFHDDHSPSMSVSEEKQIFRCFTCGESGNVFTFVEKYENMNFLEAVRVVANKIGYQLKNNYAVSKNSKYDEYYKVMDLALKYYQNNLKTTLGLGAKEYLNKRGINDETIDEFQIGLALDEKDSLYQLLTKKDYSSKIIDTVGLSYTNENETIDLFRGRIMFPVHDKSGNPIGFSARIYRNEDAPKYINTKETIIYKKGEILFNLNRAIDAIKKVKSIILVEGQMDAIRLSINGFKNVVATSGTSLTKNQIDLLKSLRCKIILCLDSDEAGDNATYNIGEELVKENLEVFVIRLAGAKDPDEYLIKNGRDAFENNLKNLTKYFDFKIIYLKNNKDLNNTVDLAKYINDVLFHLSSEEDPLLKEITINKLSEDYSLDKEILKDKLKKLEENKEIPAKVILTNEFKTKKTKYDEAIEYILYFMMNSVVYIRMFKKKLGFIPLVKYRDLCNDILCYYELNKTINLADFISFIGGREDKLKLVNEIVNNTNEELMNEKEMENFIKIVDEYIVKAKIEELKKQMKDELDINNKMIIADKITKLKKGSVKND